MNLVLQIIFSVFVFLGIIMVFVPFLPAIFYMFIMSLIFGLITHFEIITGTNLIILASILLVSILTDTFSGILGAKFGGGSKKALFWGLFGLVVGTVLIPPFGGILGLFIALLIAELYFGKDKDGAIKAATGGLLGMAVGLSINIFLAVTFFVMFVLFLIF